MTIEHIVSRAPVSCYIRTLNEERQIGGTVRAALAAVDEVVVVDSGSSDRTVEFAEAAGARVLQQPWLGLGGQKRFGEDACRNNWLLDLDADEVISPELAAEIGELFKMGAPDRCVYGLKLVTAPPIGEPWFNFSLAVRNKLYDRRAIRMPDHRAWDQLQVPKEMATGKLRGALLHFSFRDLAHHAEKQNRASSMMARDGKPKPLYVLRMRILLAMPFYFIKFFVLRGLWRVGMYGFILSVLSAHGRWLRDAKLYEAHLRQREAIHPRNANR